MGAFADVSSFALQNSVLKKHSPSRASRISRLRTPSPASSSSDEKRKRQDHDVPYFLFVQLDARAFKEDAKRCERRRSEGKRLGR